MSYASILGILLLIASYVMYSTTNTVFYNLIKDLNFIIGITSGIGIGLILGGFLGWLYKYKKIKKNDIKKED